MADFKDKKTVVSEPEVESKVHHDVEVGTADDVAEIMKKYDRESNTRIYEGIPQKILHYLLAAFALFVMWMNLFATWGEQFRRPLFLGCVILFVFALYPARKGHPGKVNRIPWYDVILAVVGSCSFFYFVINNQSILQRATRITDLEIVLGVIGILVLAECCRRVVGLPILCVASCFVIYAFVAGKTLKSIIYNLFYTTTGVIGTPIGVCSTFIVLFIIFGAFLEATGISDFFIACANRIAGWASGGPAKVAVISSALCGMVSGSSVGNTVTTGSVTIPMMKKTGYKPEFAGAVEAAASTGGQIRIGASDTICRYFLVPYFRKFHQQYPNVPIKVTNATSLNCVDLLEQGKLFVSDVQCAWMCLNCGYIFEGTAAPKVCPVCQHDQGFFVRLEMAPFGDAVLKK